MNRGVLKAAALGTMLTLLAGCSADTEPRYRVSELVRGVPMHGINGMAFHADGSLYAGSVVGQAIYRIDLSTGEVATAVGAPDGEADDVAFAADGTLAWTALIAGELRAQRPGGEPFVVAADLPMINPVAFNETGRLFAGRIQYDDLFEFELDSDTPPRLIARGLGQLNGFTFGADGKLYGPLPARGAVARIDVETGATEIIASDLGQVVGVDLDSQGNLYAMNWESGEIFRIDPDGVVTIFARLQPPLDNLVVDPDDRVYASQPSHNAVLRVEPDGSGHTMISSALVAPGGLAVVERDGASVLLVTDAYGFRFLDANSGAPLPPASELAGASSDVAVGPDRIALSYVRRGRVTLLERDTLEVVKTWADLAAPYGILLQNNDPLVADFTRGEIIRLSSTSAERKTVVADLEGPVGLAWAGPDSVFVTEALAGRVQRVSLTDGQRQVVATGLAQPEGLAVLADGSLVVAEANAGRVSLVDPIIGRRRTLADGLAFGAVVSRAPAPVYLPSGVAVDATGAIYVTEDVTNGVRKLTPLP